MVVGSHDQGADMTEKLRAARQALKAKSLAGILLREYDNVDQAIRYAKRMAQKGRSPARAWYLRGA